MSGAEDKSSISLKDGNGDPPELDINIPKLCDLPATAKQPSLPIDILLLTVEDCEFLGCHAHLRNSFRWYFDGLGYVYFGTASDDQDENVKVALMRCHEGSIGPGSSVIAVKNAVSVLKPKAVISVGHCSGLNHEKTRLGDVVVSAKLTTYASKEVVGDEEQSIGTRSLVSRRFLGLIRHVAEGWKAPLKIPEVRDVKIHNNGEFLSGPEKISSDKRRKELVDLHPQATAIEMEGEGLFSAAFDDGIEWLLVKGIADFADGNESSTVTWGCFASVMAASVVFNFLKDLNVFRKWPHYQEEKGNIEDKLGEFDDKLGKVEGNIEDKLGEVEGNIKDKLGEMEKVEGNIKDKLEQVENQVKNMSEKMDNLKEPNETSRDEESSSNLKRKSDTLTIPPVEKKPRMEDAKLIDDIRQLYKGREGWLAPFLWCEEFHFRLDDLYTRLKMVSRKKTRGTATAKIVSMYDIFKPHEESSQPRTVLIEGKPGMGKTTCCKKLVYDWATRKQEAEGRFPQFETVLLLKCRDVTESADLWEAIDDQLLPRDIEEDVKKSFFNFIRNNQSNILLVLDGLDEVPVSKLPMFKDIIQGRVLPRCRLVATARHEAGIKARIHCDTLLEIEGFTEEDARKFIVKYFRTREDSGEELAAKLLDKLSDDKNLKEMAANPLNTALLCLVCEEFQGFFPENRTKLYLEMIECVLRRYIKKKGLSEDSEDLTEVYKTQLKHLGWIALNGLIEDKLDFEESKLGNHKSDLPGFGFLSVQPGGSKLRPRRHYAFLHKSFQEMFAAFYLCCQLLNKEMTPDSIAADRRNLHQLKEVLPFVCGMLAARCEEETALALIKSLTAQVNRGDIDSNDLLTLVFKCITECKKDNSDFRLKLVGVIDSFLKNFETVSLENSGIYDADVVVLADALKYNTTVTTLDLSGNNIGDPGATALTDALICNNTLTGLNLSVNNIGDPGVATLTDALICNNTLTGLNLSVNNIGDPGVAMLTDALICNNTLTGLNLSVNNIGDPGAAALTDALKCNNTLTELNLYDNNIGDPGAVALADALKYNNTLTELNLSDNNIGDPGATALADALKYNNPLTELNLYNNNIGDPGATALADALKYNNTLIELDLSGNNIGVPGAAALKETSRVKHEQMEIETADMKRKLDTLTIPTVEKKPWMEEEKGNIEDKLGKVEGNIEDELGVVEVNMDDKLGEVEETSRDKHEQMEIETADMKRKLDTSTIPTVEKKPWMEVLSVEDIQDVESSSVVTSDGGSVSVKGVKLTCPAGAVDDPVTIKLKLEEPYTYCGLIVHHGLENDVIFCAPIINCQPNGQMFKKHVTLTVALDKEIGKSTGALLVLHGAPTNNGKIIWEDITHNSQFDLEKEELKVEINQFSRIALLLTYEERVQTKEIVISRITCNFMSFKYTLLVLLKSNHQHSPYDELALVFISRGIYREHKDSALMKLKCDGFLELRSNIGQESGNIYNTESLTVSIQLGENNNNSQQECMKFTVHVQSSVWWSTGYVIRAPFQGSSADAKILCGRVVVHGQYGHVLEDHFSQSDLCGYVRHLLGVEKVIFNLTPVAQKLRLPEETLNQVESCWKSEAEQLKMVLQSSGFERQGNTEDHAMLRKALEGLEPEEYTVKERGQMHVEHLRGLAVTIEGLQHNEPNMMKYLGHEIISLCNSVLRDCSIEMATSKMDFNLATMENYATFLEIHRQISGDVARKYEQMHSSPEDSITRKNFLMIVPQLIQAIKKIFRDERISQTQSGLRGVADKATLEKIVSDIQEAAQSENTSRLLCEVCTILEKLCLNNNDNRSTEDNIRVWDGSLSIITMLQFLKNFFQSSEAQRLYKRLHVFSMSVKKILSNPTAYTGRFLHDVHNVALSLLQFAKFDPSQLVRFELNDTTNSSNTQGDSSSSRLHNSQGNDVLKYDKSNETFSQLFWVRKESEDELQLEAVAHVHINGQIRSIGVFEKKITLPAFCNAHEAIDRVPFASLSAAVKREHDNSGNLCVAIYAMQKENIRKALECLEKELGEDVVDLKQTEITQSRLKLRSKTELEQEAGTVVKLLKLIHKWGSETIVLDSNDFVTLPDLTTGDACVPDLEIAAKIIHDLQKLHVSADKVHKKTNLSEDMITIASDKGFMISDNQASGNCMFYALSEQLELVKGIKVSHRELRESLVQFLAETPNSPDGTDLFNFVDGCPSWTDYLRSMEKDGTWGDHLIIYAAANYYETRIRVISSLDHQIMIDPNNLVLNTNPLVLGHIHEHHFVSLLPKQETSQVPSRSKKRSLSPDDTQDPKRLKQTDHCKVKQGTPENWELQKLAVEVIESWKNLGRRLNFKEARLVAFHKENEEWCEKAYKMLLYWKRRDGSKATYQVLHDALCDSLVDRKDLAEQYCCDG